MPLLCWWWSLKHWEKGQVTFPLDSGSQRLISAHPLLCLFSPALTTDTKNLFFRSCCSILLDEEGHIKLTGEGSTEPWAPAGLVPEMCGAVAVC